MGEAPKPGVVARALWAGVLAGAAVGLGDTLVAWGGLGQFLPGAGARLRCAIFAAGLDGFAAGLAAAVAAAILAALVRWTAAGRMWAVLRRRHSLTAFSLALAAPPLALAALFIAYRAGVQTIAVRHHGGLISSVIVAATVGGLAVAAIAALALGAGIEALLGLLPPGARQALGRPLASVIAALAPVVAGALVAGLAARRTLAMVPGMRAYVALVVIAIVMIPAWWAAAPILGRLRRAPRWARDAAHPAVVAVPLLLAFMTASPAVRKGANAYTGLAQPITKGIQKVADLDRDGYSPLLGGGDCNDWDASVHPGAFDAPDDGVDQNCMGGDLQISRSAADLRFVPVPPSVPADSNILLITIDTLRADHVGAYGYPRATTPALDGVAAQGTLFENAFAHAPSTRYSMPAIVTGRYPSQVLWDPNARTPASWWPGIQAANHTMAEIISEHGFTSGAFLNYEYFDRRRRMDQGFAEYHNENARLHSGTDPASTRGSSSREQADAAIGYLDAHAADRFFLWVHFYDPHADYERHPGTQEFGDSPMDIYDQEIRFTDDQIARVLDRLKQLNLYDKTIIVVTGDHGEGFGEHGVDHHGYHLYAAQTKVPMIIRVPGLAARRVSTPVGHVDLLPTLANLAGAQPESTMLGRSLLGEIAGAVPGDADRDVYQEVSFEGNHDRRGAVSKRWHLLYNMSPDNTWELYDRVADPAEAHDVWGAHGDDKDVQALRRRLLGWIDATQLAPDAAQKLAAAILKAPPAPQHPLDVDFGGAVRLIGYDLSPERARPGEDVAITWYFRCEKPLRGPWAIFVHVEQRGGAGRFIGDHDPVGGALPFERWRKGQIIADAQTLHVPPAARPGEYELHMGLWKRGTNQRAGAQGSSPISENRANVGGLVIER